MDLEKAIVRTITEISESKKLNATDITLGKDTINWKSEVGSLGIVSFRTPTNLIHADLQKSIQKISVLIAFADLITKPENKGMSDNISEAYRRGSRILYSLKNDTNIVQMSVPSHNTSYGYRKIDIKYTEISDGEYEWSIPDTEEIYQSVYDELGPDYTSTKDPAEIHRIVSEYTGISQRVSSGVPVLHATQSAREYSGMPVSPVAQLDLDYEDIPLPELSRMPAFTETGSPGLSRMPSGDYEYIQDDIDG